MAEGSLMAIVGDPVGKPAFSVGDAVTVGEFFWIVEDDHIGFATTARHFHGLKPGGSVEPGCTLIILAIANGWAVVRLERPELPAGALAPIGTVFQIALSKMARWPAMIEARTRREEIRRVLAARHCR